MVRAGTITLSVVVLPLLLAAPLAAQTPSPSANAAPSTGAAPSASPAPASTTAPGSTSTPTAPAGPAAAVAAPAAAAPAPAAPAPAPGDPPWKPDLVKLMKDEHGCEVGNVTFTMFTSGTRQMIFANVECINLTRSFSVTRIGDGPFKVNR